MLTNNLLNNTNIGHMKISASDYISVVFVQKEGDFNHLKELFLEYAISIDFDLCYQGFLQELSAISETYGPPSGAAFLLNLHGISIGCIAIRKMSPETAEIRRFYIRPGSVTQRNKKLLLDVALEWARQTGIHDVLLKSADSMASAHKACIDAGFTENSTSFLAADNEKRNYGLSLRRPAHNYVSRAG
jgi:GNAT superfamily N-acetyltransferase